MKCIQYWVGASLLFCIMTTHAELASAKTAYKIEWGMGVGGQYLNDYRGSKETQFNALPFPIIIYKGDIFKIDDEEGMRADLIKNNRFEVNLSGDSALRSSTDQNQLRLGMPTLDTAFQLGPSLNFLVTGNDFNDGLLLRLPVRAVMTLNTEHWSMDSIGYTVNPEIAYKKRNIVSGWNLNVAAGPIYGSQEYHEYYYGVADEYITPSRAGFKAEAGYSGTFYEAELFGKKGNLRFRFGLRYDNLSGADFLASDLVETQDFFSLGFGLGWMFHTSSF